MSVKVKTHRSWYHDHTEHNPECDIICSMVDGLNYAYITYVKNLKTGQESCEYYSGPNYLPFSIAKKSYSRYWPSFNDIPKKYQDAWIEMRDWYKRALDNKKQLHNILTLN